jgi:hypothetical protein
MNKVFAIVVTELSGNKTELCRVGSNPEAVVRGVQRLTQGRGKWGQGPRYQHVEIRELTDTTGARS